MSVPFVPALPAPVLRLPRIARLRAALAEGNPQLAATGLFLLLAMAPTLLALALDPRTTAAGASLWVKPLKFEASLALHLLTVAAALLLLPEPLRRSRFIGALGWALSGAAAMEAGYIALRAAQAMPSHYGDGSPLSVALYQAMGVGALTLVAGASVIGLVILRSGRGPAPLALGAGLGLALGGALGGFGGFAISANGGPFIGEVTAGLPLTGWSRSGGDLRVAHFFGLHLMQALPVFGAILWIGGVRRWRPALLAAAAAGVALFWLVWRQALAGQAFV